VKFFDVFAVPHFSAGLIFDRKIGTEKQGRKNKGLSC